MLAKGPPTSQPSTETVEAPVHSDTAAVSWFPAEALRLLHTVALAHSTLRLWVRRRMSPYRDAILYDVHCFRGRRCQCSSEGALVLY